jgi:hypothetical protein
LQAGVLVYQSFSLQVVASIFKLQVTIEQPITTQFLDF